MAYVVGYSMRRNDRKISEATYQDARAALEGVFRLEASDETIRYIKAPWGGEIGKGELKMYAEEEAPKS
jgi:hypothetical protein